MSTNEQHIRELEVLNDFVQYLDTILEANSQLKIQFICGYVLASMLNIFLRLQISQLMATDTLLPEKSAP